MKTYNTDFDEEFGEMEDDVLSVYSYPTDSNGFSFISHLVTVHANTDKNIIMVTNEKETVKREFRIYNEGSKRTSFNTDFPADNIKIIEESEKSIKTLLNDLENSIIIYHNIELLSIGIDKLDEIREKLSEKDISIWLCDPYNNRNSLLEEIADIVLEFNHTIESTESFEYIYVNKHRHRKSKSHIQIGIQFKPYMKIETKEKD